MNQNAAPSTGGQAAAREMVAGNSAWIAPLRQEIGRVIVGQKHLLDRLLIAMLTMEAAFGIAGVVAAPIYYAYLKDELKSRGLI